MKAHSDNGVGMFLAGPGIFCLLLACLALLLVLAWALRRLDSLVRLGARARRRLGRGRAMPTLWGLSAGVLIFAASVLLIQTHVLALPGVLLLAAGVCLAGAGVTVAAWAVGDDLTRLLSGGNETIPSLRLGLTLLFFVSFLPAVGWLVAGLAGASGVGAILEVLLTRGAAGED